MLEAFYWLSLGLILGSFTNVLILRFGHQSLWGRSACPSCHRQLAPIDLIPVFSWLFLRGQCRTCKAAISVQYPLVELLVGALVLAIGCAPIALHLKLLGICIAIVLAAITVYDLYHMLIPDRWAYTFIVLAFIFGVFSHVFVPEDITLFLASGPVLALPLFLLWSYSRGTWMGFGDVKLMLGIGWLLGLYAGYIALSLAFIIGAIVGVAILIPLPYIVRALHGITSLSSRGVRFTMKSEVPFGPFLVLGMLCVWLPGLYNVDVPALLLRFLSLS